MKNICRYSVVFILWTKNELSKMTDSSIVKVPKTKTLIANRRPETQLFPAEPLKLVKKLGERCVHKNGFTFYTGNSKEFCIYKWWLRLRFKILFDKNINLNKTMIFKITNKKVSLQIVPPPLINPTNTSKNLKFVELFHLWPPFSTGRNKNKFKCAKDRIFKVL